MEDPTLATSPPPPNDLTNPLTTSTSPPSSNVGSQPHLHPVKLKLQEFLRRSEFKTKSEKEEEEGEEGIEEGKEEEKGGELFLALRALALVSRGENNGKFHHNSSQVPTPLATPSLFPPTTTSTSVTSTITSTQFEPPAIRKTLDLQTHQVYRAYLEELKKLDESVERLERNLVTSHDRCIKIETTFKTSCHTASELSKTLLELDTLKKTTESRSREVEDFLTKYTLPPEEMEKLQDPTQVVDHKFLDLVEKLHRLEGEANLIKNQGETLGQDILNALVACRTTSDYRLEEYLNSQLKLAVDTKFRLGNLDPDPLMQRVVMALNLKVNRWLEEVIKVRLDHLQENFVVALSQGARPIELHAPDPIRYVGDMLAWVHQVIVEEKEFYFNLFSINFHQGEDHHRENSLSHHTKLNDLDYLISKLRLTFQSLNRSVDGVLLLLTERVQHVLRDLEGPALGFQLSNLIHIHGDVLLKNLGVASLPPAIKSKLTDSDLNLSTNERILNLITFSQDAFYQILEDDMAQLLAAAELPPDNLSVPTSVHTALDDLVKIISHPDVQDPVKVLDTVLDPLVQLCDREASFVDAHESSIYIINCLTHIQNCLSSYSVASNRIESFAPIIIHNLELLVELEYEALMDLTHLNQLMPLTDAYHHLLTKIMDGDSQETAMDEFIQLCLDQNLPLVHTALQSFETFLYTVDLDQDFTVPTTPGSPTTHNDDGDIVGLKRLKLPTRQVYQLRTQALSHFLNSYSSIYPLIDKISTKVKSDPELPPFPYRLRPVAELETLLGI